MSQYSDLIFDHYHHPQNVGELQNATHSAELKNLSCGDAVSVDLVVENGKITTIAYQLEGCAISTASMSLLSDEIKNMDIEHVLQMSVEEIKDLLGIEISYARTKCATLGLEAIKKALTKNNE